MKKNVCWIILTVWLFCFPLSAFAAEGTSDAGPVRLNGAPAAPDISAKAYALIDSDTGTLIAGCNENAKLYPASVTKIMTLLLVCDAVDDGKLSFDETVTCSETAAAKGGSQIWLEPGEQMTVHELLKASFVYSANDACTLLAERVAGSEDAFVQLMNARAEELGMRNTHFDNCTGLDDDTSTHLTSAYDVAIMSRELMKKDYIRNYTTIRMDTLRGGKTQLVNTNKLIRSYPGATGLKTGTTSKAGCCVSAAAERDGLGLIAVVLGANNSSERFDGAKALLDYGFANYEIFSPEADTAQLREVSIAHGTVRSVMPCVEKPNNVLMRKGESAGITQTVVYAENIQAPVAKGTVLGTVSFYSGAAEVAGCRLICPYDVPKLSVGKALWMIIGSVSAKNKQ